MKTAIGAPLAAALTVVLGGSMLSACSKPASEPADSAVATSDVTTAPANAAAGATAMTTDAAGGATSPGGVVSPPPSPQNDPINADANAADASQAPASNSFTEGQAKGHIEKAGYTDVTALTKTPDGLWTAKAKKDGKTMDVSLDFKGAVTAK